MNTVENRQKICPVVIGAISTIAYWLSFLYFMSAVMLKDTNVKNYSRYKLTLFYIIIFFLVSFISEGYIFSISSGISLIFWLTLGSFQDLSFKVKQNYGNKA